jgi:large subunit ribosomal protein L23
MIIDLVKYPIITEKSCRLIENNQYTFDVDLRLTKPEIKKMIQDLFNVIVIAVNTHCPVRQTKSIGIKKGFKTKYKRVIVTVKKDQSIDIFSKTTNS